MAGATGYPRPADSGLLAATVMFADGTQEQLGTFGPADTEPLCSATVQSLVPALFHLAASREPANIAQVLLGHGGTLAWLQDSCWARGQAAGASRNQPRGLWCLDRQVKELFDPPGRFPGIRQPQAQE